MSLKAKLASTIAAVCMVICLLSVGIFAATSGSLFLQGTVSFGGTGDIHALFEAGDITGQADGSTIAAGWKDDHSGEWELVPSAKADGTPSNEETWDGFAFLFKSTDGNTLDTITLTLTVKNLGSKAFTVVARANPSVTNDPLLNVQYAVEYGDGAATVTAKGTATDTATVTITIDAVNSAAYAIPADTAWGAEIYVNAA